MRTLEELLAPESAMSQVHEWLASAKNQYSLLAPSEHRGQVLVQTQVTTRSTMGALAYETGGVLVDHGWLRLLGSGHRLLSRTLPGWNADKVDRCYLVADDVAGGFYAVNGGAFGADIGKVYYWAPDALEWEPMELGYSEFFRWSLIGDFETFYAHSRWKLWKQDLASISADQCVSFWPPLWTKEGSPDGSYRGVVPIHEAFDLKQDMLRQLTE
jgi:hypothetical protein